MRVPQHPIAESELHPLVDAMGALAASTDFESAARSIFEACRAVIRAESGYLAVLANDGSAEIAYLSVRGETHGIPPHARMGLHGLSRDACRSGTALQCNHFRSSQWAHLLPDAHPTIDNVLVAPLVSEGRTLGVLTVANKPEGFDEADKRLATALAQVAARALTKSRTLKALEQSEERFRTAAERAPDPVIVADADGHVTSWNPAAERTFGWSADEIVGRHLTDLVPERSRERQLDTLAPAHEGHGDGDRSIEPTGLARYGAHCVRHPRLHRDALAGDEYVGDSRAFRAVLHQAQMVATGDTTVLILGETGTGKELLARLIHRLSRRASRQLVPVNCASIPETLVESELFGYEKGAFTGAVERRPGKFEAASGGTLFLDEIGDFPLSAQAKLLRVLQDGRVQRVGSTRLTAVDVRVIAATNTDLDAAVRDKRFRSDLYYRLGVFPIRLPALRDRVEDIRPMFKRFVAQFSQRLRRGIAHIDEDVFKRLEHHRWPGNVRELQNVAERAVVLAEGSTIDASSIILPRQEHIPVPESDTSTLADAERHAIVEALHQTAGRVSGRGGAADRLGLKATTLHAKMRKLGIARREV